MVGVKKKEIWPLCRIGQGSQIDRTGEASEKPASLSVVEVTASGKSGRLIGSVSREKTIHAT
jgi:hypothetical protein